VIVLDTFVGNDDRNNMRNALFGLNGRAPTDSTFMFLDHANSLNMGNRWANGGWQQVVLPPMPDLLRQAADWSVLHGVVDAIERLPNETIDEVVGRIPDDYVLPQHRDIIADGLKGRRNLVRQAVEVFRH
jgi:hypothetical protein